jgi:DNA-binding NarL/FixJ family response regulator
VATAGTGGLKERYLGYVKWQSEQDVFRMEQKTKLLIVEDHHITLQGLTASLGSAQDFVVVGTAATSDEGLYLLRSRQPDIVLLDLHLPGSKGPKATVEEFCKSSAKVVILSAENRMAFVQIVLNAGAAGFLLKSETPEQIIAAMRRVIAGATKPVLSQDLLPAAVSFTKIERHMLQLLAQGKKYQQIADERSVSPATVKRQCELLLLKLHLESRE